MNPKANSVKTGDVNVTDEEEVQQTIEEEEEIEPIWGNDFVEKYLGFADQTSRNNKALNTAGMYCLLGQAIRDVVIPIRGSWVDGRISTLIIQDSGTGKDPAFDFVKMVADLADLQMRSLGSMTSAGLIGSLTKGGEVHYGAAYDADIIGFKEASTLFHTAKNEHSSDLINYMNQILDRDGHVCKRMAQGEIEFDSKASFFGTTYPPRNGIRYIPEGFIPRLMISFRTVKSQFYFDISDWVIDNIGEDISGDKMDILRLGKTVDLIKKTVTGKYFTFEGKAELRSIKARMSDTLDTYSDDVVKFARPFITRNVLHCAKLACCHASLDEISTVVKREHFVKAGEYINLIWKGTLDFIDKYKPYIGDKKIGIIEEAVKDLTEEGTVEITLRDILRKTHFSSTEVLGRLTTLKDMELVDFDQGIKTLGRRTTKIKWTGYCDNVGDEASDKDVTKSDEV